MSDPMEEEEGGGDGWLVSFADLMTLLFAAFVVLYGLIEVGPNPKMRGIDAPAREVLVTKSAQIKLPNNEIEGISLGRFGEKSVTGDQLQDKIKINNERQSPFAAIEPDLNQVENFIDRMAAEDAVNGNRFRKAAIALPDEKGITIRLAGAYFFAAQEYRLNRTARKRLLALAKFLRKMDRKIVIEGHSAINKKRARFSADEISALRAGYAARLFTEKAGFKPQEIETIAYGTARPLASNVREIGREKNRRIEIKLIYQ